MALAALGVVGLWFYVFREPKFPDSILYCSASGEAGEAPDERTFEAFPSSAGRGNGVVVFWRRGAAEKGMRIVIGIKRDSSATYIATGSRRETDRGSWELCTLDPIQDSGWIIMR